MNKKREEFVLVPATFRARKNLDYLPPVDFSKFMKTAEEIAAERQAADQCEVEEADFQRRKQAIEEEAAQKKSAYRQRVAAA
jgi:hypothetical protein